MRRSSRAFLVCTIALWTLSAAAITYPVAAEVGVDECPVLVAEARTSFSLSNGSFVGSVATFAADPGNRLVGASTLTCQADLTWDGVPPTAEKTNAVVAVPNTGLNGGDTIEIQLTGFPPFADLGWAQCIEPFAPDPSDSCMDFDPAGRGVADATGALTTTSRLQRFIYVADGARWVDCTDPAESCVIGAADGADIPNGNWTPLGFNLAPAPPTVRGTISLAPPGPVPGPGSVISVTGTGFRPDEVVDVYQCAADPVQPSDCNRRAGSAVTDGAGAFAADVTVAATVTPPGGSTTNCFDAGGFCAIAAAEAVDFPGTVVATDLAVPVTVPGAPTIIRNATAGPGSATASWTAPVSSGGSPTTGYVVTPYIGFFALPSVTFNSTATTQTITGLTNGTTYRFKVAAINAIGTGPTSKVTNQVTPAATVPGAPTIIPNAPAGDGQATVSWTAPASDGGSPITGYVVTPYIGYYPLAPQTFSSVATTQVISALANGTTYRFRVQALNGVGTGGYSKVTNSVTPTA